ncbi:peptidoglycan DD-metalloendopeptidase family protein [Microlunatus antarcticus]|uniref:Murein DD-endopeptidase MepM/ murein hydrolase activator NlpD n=1 Tax=Microlunatus antarcticus TaxID=53388 RepID=A0A7W5JWZ0_9ACTN|nr:murein DD-endopeptidase MepM/ murein hydrolase activator NlpD [Microlunatus antarcticus]
MPDLPRVLTDAPVADDLPSGTLTGHRPTRLGGRLNALVLTGALVVALSGGLVISTAQADDLTDQRSELKSQISRTKADLSESSAALSNAGVQVDRVASQLASAQAELAQARSALATAKADDVRLAGKLKRAQADLAKARAAVLDCQERLDAKKQMVGVIVRNQYQQQTNLMPIAVLTSHSTTDLATRMQWATTMLDTTQSKIDALLALETQLKAKRASLAKAEKKVADDRAEAADSLAQTRRLEAQASSAAAAVAGHLVQQQAIEKAAAQDVAQDRSHYAKLTAERATVENRIAVRVAKQKAAAKAAAAKEAARQVAAAKAEARAAARSKASSPKRASRSTSSARVAAPRAASSASTSSSGSHHGFIYPVSAPITSPYGMRLHPVLHVWKLHDGTDFGAGCGAAIHAAADGVVAEKYYNAGYGNRLMIDHGKVDGKYVTTGYNHAIRYVVGVGDHVKQGQVIGYVGTTGYSTGCHLHLMVWLNGGMVNPMSWY